MVWRAELWSCGREVAAAESRDGAALSDLDLASGEHLFDWSAIDRVGARGYVRCTLRLGSEVRSAQCVFNGVEMVW